jgi:hypothetical protein
MSFHSFHDFLLYIVVLSPTADCGIITSASLVQSIPVGP